MSIFIEKNGKKTIPVSLFIKILGFWGLIGLSAAVMHPLHALFSSGMDQIRSDFIDNLQEITGMEIHYSSIRPAMFGSFSIRNVSFQKDNESFFSVSRINIDFSMPQLLINKKIFINTVQIVRPNLHIDLDRDKTALENFLSMINRSGDGLEASFQSGGESPVSRQIADFLQQQAVLQIRNGSFKITDGDTVYLLDGFRLNIREDDGKFIFDASMLAQYKLDNLPHRTILIQSELNASGFCGNNLEYGRAQASFTYINCYEQNSAPENTSFFRPVPKNDGGLHVLFNVLPFSVTLDYEDKKMRFHRQDENSPSVYQFLYDMQAAEFSAEISLNDFHLNEILTLSSRLPDDFESLLLMRITGGLSFKYQGGVMDYAVNFAGSNKPGDASLLDSFLINASGDNEKVFVDDLIFYSSVHGTLGFNGTAAVNPLRPEGIIIIDGFSAGTNEDINASLNVKSGREEILISGLDINIAGALINNLEMILHPADNDISLSASVFFENEGALYIDALYNKKPGEAEASLFVEKISLYEITEMLRPFTEIVNIPLSRTQLQESFFSAEIFLSTDFSNVVYNAPNLAFNIAGAGGNLSLSGTDRMIALSEGIVYINENEYITSSAVMNFENPMELFFTANAAYRDLSWNIEGHILDRTTLIIHDPNGLYVYGNISNTGAMTGYIEADNFPVPLNNRTVFFNTYSALRYNSHDFWNLDINYFTVREAGNPQSGAEEFLRISGIADQGGAHFTDILFRDFAGELLGGAQLSWDMDFSYIEIAARLTDGEGSGAEVFELEGIFRDKILNLAGSVSNMQVNRFIEYNEPIIAGASFSAVWNSINSFDAKLNVSSFYTRAQNAPVFGAVDINFSNDELIIKDLNVNFQQMKIILPEIIFSRTQGKAKGSLNIEGYNREKKLHGIIGLDIDFLQADSWINIRDAAQKFNGTIEVSDLEYGGSRNEKMIFVLSGGGGALSFSGGPRGEDYSIKNMLRVEMDKEGNFFAGLSSPLPIQGLIIGSFNKGHVDAYCNNFYIDLQQLYALAAHDDSFNITGGYIAGRMNFLGPLWNPQMNGSGIATSMRFQVPEYLGADIRAVPFEVQAEGHYMTFGPVVTSAGNGGGTVNGWFYFSNWVPVNIGLDISIPRESPIPYDFNIAGFTAKGNASGSLLLDVDIINYQMEIKGDLFTNEAELGMNMSRDQDIPSDLDDDYSIGRMNSLMDFKITAGSMVEFMWPPTNPVIRATPEMGTVIHVTSDTLSMQFTINSDVNIRSGEVYYFERSFYIRQGTIVFRENETQFNPRLTARAEIRDRADAGPVTISMIVENQPLLSFEPRFESTPSLTQLEIYSILGQNFNSLQAGENPEMAQRMFLSSTADILTQLVANSETFAQFMFFRQFERQVRDFLQLDMFSIRTRLLHNAVILGAAGLGQDPVDRNFTVGNYFDNTTVFMGKYIGRDIFIHGMLTLRYDENRSTLSGLVFEPDIGIEFHTPFLNIRWDFFPYNPENWWVSDNSITLSWSRSF